MSDEHIEQTQVEGSEPLKDYSTEIKSSGRELDFDQKIEQWFDSHIRGSIAGRDTQVWNHLVACKERLKEMFRR